MPPRHNATHAAIPDTATGSTRRHPSYRIHGQHLFQGRPGPIHVARVNVSHSHQSHDHDFFELAWILAGVAEHRSVRGTTPIQAGDVFCLRPGVWHGYERPEGLVVYNCCFGTAMLRRELGWTRRDPELAGLLWSLGGSKASGSSTSDGSDNDTVDQPRGMRRLRLAPAALAACERRLDELAGLVQQSDTPGPLLVGGLLSVLGELVQGLDGAERRRLRGQPTGHPAVLRAMRRIERELDHPWRVEALAKRVHLTPAHLTRLFTAHTGLPPIAYLNRCRAEAVAELLLRSDLSVAEIGQRVGWWDPNYVARRFRAEFGISPTEYRRRFAPVSSSTPSD